MWSRLALVAVAALLGAQAPAVRFPPGTFQNRAAIDAAPAAGFAGMGDVVAFDAAWSTRAYSAATRGTPALNVCNVADVACADLSSDATTGALVVGTIGGSSCSIITCTVKIIYDQSGALSCGGSACNATQNTIANRGVLVVSCQNSQPCIRLGGAPQAYDIPSMGSHSQPLGVTGVAFTSSLSAGGILASTSTTEFLFRFDSNVIQIYAGGGVLAATANRNNWYAAQAVFDATSSVLNVNGSEVTPGTDPGSNGTTTTAFIGDEAFADFCTCDITETGIKFATLTGGNRSSLSSNQRTFWGF